MIFDSDEFYDEDKVDLITNGKATCIVYEVDHPENSWQVSFSQTEGKDLEKCFESIKKSRKINWDLYDRGLMVTDIKITKDNGLTYRDWNPDVYPDSFVTNIYQLYLVVLTGPANY